jgi:hypothetical protein
MKVSVRSKKVKLPKGKNEYEREPESEENRWRFWPFRSFAGGHAI